MLTNAYTRRTFLTMTAASVAIPSLAGASSAIHSGADRAGPWGVSARNFSNRLSEAVFRIVNHQRQAQRLPALRPDQNLARLAGGYCAEMIAGDFFGHYTPDGRSLRNRLEDTGLANSFSEVVETLWRAEAPHMNWFADQNADMAVREWFESKRGQRETLLSPQHTLAGVGAALREERMVVAMLVGSL